VTLVAGGGLDGQMSSAIGCAEAEAALLGCCLYAPASAAGLLAGLTDDDWTDPRHLAAYAGIRDAVAAGVPPDPVTVLGAMRAGGHARALPSDRGPGTFLADLMASAPTPASGGHYRRILLQHSYRRAVAQYAERLSQAAVVSELETLKELVRSGIIEVAFARARLDDPAGNW